MKEIKNMQNNETI
jgi:spore coat protein CotH